MTTVLIVTTGHTDVQLVDNGRRELAKSNIRQLHAQLRDNPDAWEVMDAPSERNGEAAPEFPAERPWKLCTPKFDAVLNWFEGVPPDRLLLLETTRTKEKTDPHFAGDILQRRAKEYRINNVTRCSYLGPNDRWLEDRDLPIDAIIRRDIVERIESAIRNVVNGATRVIVAATGGMPEVKMLVRELARLHAPSASKLENLEVDNGSTRNEPDKAVTRERFDPVEVVRLRKQSLSLIEKGNLLGAWGAVEHLNSKDHPWTQVVEWLGRFAASLPIANCDISVLKHTSMAVLAALRVELALSAKDIPSAVHGTVAFFEAALWDWLRRRDFAKEDGASSGSVESGFAFTTDPRGEKKDRFRKCNGVWRVDDFKKGADAWLAILGKSALTTLGQALSDDIRELRNDVAHNEPTPALMDNARGRMRTAALWSDHDTFLSQPLVQAVLRELGEPHPESLCDSLLQTVRKRLLAGPPP